jgi:hypothetical protein
MNLRQPVALVSRPAVMAAPRRQLSRSINLLCLENPGSELAQYLPPASSSVTILPRNRFSIAIWYIILIRLFKFLDSISGNHLGASHPLKLARPLGATVLQSTTKGDTVSENAIDWFL